MNSLQRFYAAFLESVRSRGSDLSGKTLLHCIEDIDMTSSVIVDPEGTDVVIHGGHVGKKKKMKTLSDEECASLWMFYLQHHSWPEARRLHVIHRAYVDAGHEDPVEVKGAKEKLDSMKRMREWYLELPEHPHVEFLYLQRKVYKRKRCQLGELRLRSSTLDKSSAGSYFLAKVFDVHGETFRVGRAKSFFWHRPPGATDTSSFVPFVEAIWLKSPSPSKTVDSQLPIVFQDDKPKWRVSDADMADGLLSRVWPLSSVEPSPVSLLPLDIDHDLPPHLTVRAPGWQSEANQCLSRYAKQTWTTADYKEPGLAAVICLYSEMNSKFSDD
jgi:hypothetical protein